MAVIRIGHEVVIDADAPSVFDFVVDLDRLAEWSETVQAVEREASGPPVVGEHFVLHVKALGMTQSMPSEITEIVPGEEFAYRSEGPPPTHLRYLVKEADEGVVLRCEAEVEPTGPYVALTPLIRKVMRDDITSSLERAADRLGR